ncbi:sulfur carrier protein ThiS [Flavobacterium humi]|uniref:Sulfur carrier protein ThiS n=1 Tax=Flavobacterium humi TaxID=2562683 RepID=A0A4Z0L816_9FLAO|nr:sulfur carrier protein ThiS [Flavobacterium humi]TGD57280.1 sulfur carrier protein ThiS [Flavobacterium humi]
MELNINNRIKSFAPDSLTVQALLDLETPNRQNGIAVAVNQRIIPKSDWETHSLYETDDILIISATQGG